MKRLFLPFLVICLTSCNQSAQDSKKATDLKADTISNTKKSNELIIDNKCAVIYNPDTVKIELLKTAGEDGFYTAADDAMTYVSQSRDFLVKHNIKVVETDLRFVDFYANGKVIKRFDLSGKDKVWGIILFNGKDEPVESDLTNIEPDYEKIMKK